MKEPQSTEDSQLSDLGDVVVVSNSPVDGGQRTKKAGQPRACAECNRKKIKCDKASPRCSLCTRAGHECNYPKSRKRAVRPWQLEQASRPLLSEPGNKFLSRLLDTVDPSVLASALERRQHDSNGSGTGDSSSSNAAYSVPKPDPKQATPDKDNDGTYNTEGSASLVSDTDVHVPDPTSHLPGGPMDTQIAGSMETVPILYSRPDHTLFFTDAFDPSLGSWLTDGFLHPQNLDLAGGEMPDFPLPGMQYTFTAPNLRQPFGFLPNAAPTQRAERADFYSLSAPADVVDETIDVFFQHISSWLPLFHRPRFYAHFDVGGIDTNRYQTLTLEDCLIVNAVCALGARFSQHAYFEQVAPKERAEPFLSQATALFQDSLTQEVAVQPSLSLLQGFILLGWYHQVCGSSARCGSLIGISCRLAYDLGLNNIDLNLLESDSAVQWDSAESWSMKEELRRAWWLVWELDMFSATVLHRPHTIDKTQINVLLPVSDDVWFANTPVSSVPILASPLEIWKTLKDSSNQHDRAWFLVTSFIRALTHDIVHRRQTTAQNITDFEASITCYSLLVPNRFNVSTVRGKFDASTFSGCNWIVSHHLMLHTVRSTLRLFCEKKFPALLEGPTEGFATEDLKLVCSVIQVWDPNYIAQACPLVSATLLGPWALNARAACKMAADSDDSRPIYLEMLKLVLGKIAMYWQIAASVLEVVQLLEAHRSVIDLVNSRKDDIHQLPLLLPKTDEMQQ